MTKLGKNIKITVDRADRAYVEKLFGEVLGCSVVRPRPDIDVYRFEDGTSLGAYLTDSSDALAASDHKKAPWLELAVDDPEAVTVKLAALGIEPFEYFDKEHRYFCPKTGPVFRLAKL